MRAHPALSTQTSRHPPTRLDPDALSWLWALDVEDGLAAADANYDGLCRLVRRRSFPMDYSAGNKGEVSGSAVESLAPIGAELHLD